MEGNTPESTRYVTLAEHQALQAENQTLQAQFIELVKHVQDIRFNGSTIELPDNLQVLIGLKVAEQAAE